MADMFDPKSAGAGRGFRNPATIGQREISDTSWDKLRDLHTDLVTAGMIDRDSIPKYKKKYDAAAPALRNRIQTIKENTSYEPEGIGRTYAKGGKVSSASSRGDGIATKGKTRGRMC